MAAPAVSIGEGTRGEIGIVVGAIAAPFGITASGLTSWAPVTGMAVLTIVMLSVFCCEVSILTLLTPPIYALTPPPSLSPHSPPKKPIPPPTRSTTVSVSNSPTKSLCHSSSVKPSRSLERNCVEARESSSPRLKSAIVSTPTPATRPTAAVRCPSRSSVLSVPRGWWTDSQHSILLACTCLRGTRHFETQQGFTTGRRDFECGRENMATAQDGTSRFPILFFL